MLRAAAIAFLVVIAALAGGCGGAEDTGSSADGSAQQTGAGQQSESTTAEPAEESAASVGEPVTVGDVVWTVTDVLQSDILVSRLGTKEGNFVIVDVTFQNNSNQDITFATPFVTLLDSQGREVEADTSDNFTHVAAEQNMFAAHVQPGVTKDGKIIFEVEPDSSGFKLKVGEARFASDKVAYIDLGL
jgi:hypothetical protein